MKTAVVIFLAALVAAASASGCDTLTRLKVQGQWRRAYSSGDDREHFTQALWRAVFAQAPEAKALFNNLFGEDSNSGKFKAFGERQLSNLDSAISSLDQPEILKAQIAYMLRFHGPKQVPEKYYAVFRTALGHILPAQLGRCFDKEAWKACFAEVAPAPFALLGRQFAINPSQ